MAEAGPYENMVESEDQSVNEASKIYNNTDGNSKMESEKKIVMAPHQIKKQMRR